MTALPPVSPAQVARARAFRALHEGSEPLRMANAWDAWSARVLIGAGAPALGTSSFAVAAALGHGDGERLPWPRARASLSEVVEAAGEVPVSADIEAGRGGPPAAVARTVDDVITAGAVGINLEDTWPRSAGRLVAIGEQQARLAAARARADGRALPLFVNARCDVWFGADLPPDRCEAEAVARALAYAEAGADGVFFPGLVDRAVLRRLCARCPVAVGVMVWPGLPEAAVLAACGVRRVSQGGSAFLAAAAALDAAARAFLAPRPTPRVA